MAFNLTEGFIEAISSNSYSRFRGNNVVLVVYDLKPLKNSSSDTIKYRVMLYDGKHVHAAMVVSPLTHTLVEEGKLIDGAVITVTNFAANPIQNKIVLFIQAFEYTGQSNITLPNAGGSAPAQPTNPPTSVPAQFASNPNRSPYSDVVKKNWTSPAPSTSNYTSSGPMSFNAPNTSGFVPISAITPFVSKWTIKARVAAKAVRTYKNAKGDGKLATFDFVDSLGDDIRATAFNAAADKFNAMLTEGGIYTVSKCQVKIANKQYNTCKHQYELTLNETTDITPCENDTSIQEVSANIVPISNISSLAEKTTVDVFGITQAIGQLSMVKTKNGDTARRNITICDSSQKQIDVTFWGDSASNLSEDKVPIGTPLLVKGARVSDYNGKTLSGSSCFISPNIAELSKLIKWYESAKSSNNLNVESLSERSSGAGGVRMESRKTSQQIIDERLGMSDKMDFFSMVATVGYIKHDENKQPYYQGCANVLDVPDKTTGETKKQMCGKKVTMVDGRYLCDKCNSVLDRCDYRWTLNIGVSDAYGITYLSCFNETAVKIMGKSAEEMSRLQSEDPQMAEYVYSNALFKTFLFKCRAKAELVNDKQMNKITVSDVIPIDYIQESKILIDDLKKLL